VQQHSGGEMKKSLSQIYRKFPYKSMSEEPSVVRLVSIETQCTDIQNESVPKIITMTISILVISNHNSFRVLFDKIASYILFEEYS